MDTDRSLHSNGFVGIGESFREETTSDDVWTIVEIDQHIYPRAMVTFTDETVSITHPQRHFEETPRSLELAALLHKWRADGFTHDADTVEYGSESDVSLLEMLRVCVEDPPRIQTFQRTDVSLRFFKSGLRSPSQLLHVKSVD